MLGASSDLIEPLISPSCDFTSNPVHKNSLKSAEIVRFEASELQTQSVQLHYPFRPSFEVIYYCVESILRKPLRGYLGMTDVHKCALVAAVRTLKIRAGG